MQRLLWLFSPDLNAVQMAGLTGLNRNTVNRIPALAKARIAQMAESESLFSAGEIELNEFYFGPCRVKGKRDRGATGKMKRGDRVFIQVVKNGSAAT